MIGALAHSTAPRTTAHAAFATALAGFDRARPVTVLGHFDADGLAATAILVRALRAAGWRAEPRVTGKGETPWDEPIAGELARADLGGLIVTDLGTRADPVAPGVPTVVIDHHLPTGLAPGATVVSGNGLVPEPTSALLAWWCAGALGDQADLLWLAALGLVGDMAARFPELDEAEARWGKTAIRDAVSLVNAPRRTASADASPALALLLRGDGPKVVTKADSPERDALVAAKAEVRDAVEAARRVPPRVAGDVALIRFDSPCQIHPLIAQQWRGRLKDKIVLAANTGYRPGWVHFAARSARGQNLVDFLRDHRPPGADSRYGNGHAQATGGALRPADWNAFVTGLGLPDQQVPA
ncbi:phosphoesterase [Sphingomonas bacterium]|uniref:phosphoesterase n=1 Tax=Sphingomonas bacterium TaxID=1895847 RepID=UPI001C2D6D7A|nr:phosphoesterase [Sphingomonas bacterium]